MIFTCAFVSCDVMDEPIIESTSKDSYVQTGTSLSSIITDFTVENPVSDILIDELLSFYDSTSLILILHNDPDFGRYTEWNSDMIWKAIPNSDYTIENYLSEDGYLLENIQPNPDVDKISTKVGSTERVNVYSCRYDGKSYYMFNPVKLVRKETYITLLCDYFTFGSSIVDDMKFDDRYYLYTHLPLPENLELKNRLYIFMLEDSFNFVEHAISANNSSDLFFPPAIDKISNFRINTCADYKILEYSLTDGSKIK